MQSILQNKTYLPFPTVTEATGPLTRTRQSRLLMIYALIYTLGTLLLFTLPHSGLSAFGHSLMLPGSGFLGGWSPNNELTPFSLWLFGLSIFLLALSGFLWFATGNVILPPFMWAALAAASSYWQGIQGNLEFSPLVTAMAFTIGPILITALLGFHFITLKRGQKRRKQLNLTLAAQTFTPSQSTKRDELTFFELQHMRLFLDRALQPVGEFEGFEWLDQFQTAAVRYQINFISYALSMAQANYLPDFTGYLSQAQQNLKAKQENHRIWKYWKLENIWGNLRTDADPIARDNIMYSGFVGAQLALAQQADPRGADKLDGLKARSKNTHFDYSQNDIIKTLVEQYKTASYGLLSCEPNWVYPLCNAITATAIRAHDTTHGTQYWGIIKDGFRRVLETEFMTPNGKLIPFRSNYTGFAPPQVGGAVMQAFPCVFLNAVLPDIARRQWAALKIDMRGKSWQRALWPADVGNYNFSRASSYAATALAAREMGDDVTADLLLGYMEEECPTIINGGITHYSKASLWANANAFMARIGTSNGFRNLITTPQDKGAHELHLAHVDPATVLIAKARTESGVLTIVAYPVQHNSPHPFTIAGLNPHADYILNGAKHETFTAKMDGTYVLDIELNGRTELNISKID